MPKALANKTGIPDPVLSIIVVLTTLFASACTPLPQGLGFQKPGDIVPGEPIIHVQYLNKTISSSTITDYGGIYMIYFPKGLWTNYDYYCKETNEKVHVVTYFKTTKPGTKCSFTRKAYICGNIYWIQDVYCAGPELRGPFNRTLG